MKIYKKILLIILISILLTISLLLIPTIYAKYRTAIHGNTSILISRWDIKVNESSVKNNSDISTLIKPVFPGNEFIAANVIAPTAEGYFDLNLDYTDVDVAFKYSIKVASDALSPIQDLIPIAYSIDQGPRIDIVDPLVPIENTIALNPTQKQNSIRIYIQWNDNPETSSMDNKADTESTRKADKDAVLNVQLEFIQVAQ